MTDIEMNDIDVATPSVVRTAARDFAAVLAETPQFKAFEQAYETFRNDAAAQQALVAYQTKVRSLRAVMSFQFSAFG